MQLSPSFLQDPSANLDYTIDWSQYLQGTEYIIQTPVINATVGLTVGNITISGGKVVFWVSGGIQGQKYVVDCTIITSLGRTDSRSIVITFQTR